MTHRTTEGKLVICSEGKHTCEFCKKVGDTRPYGPKGETVCFECAMKDEDAAEEQFKKRFGTLDDAGNIVVRRESILKSNNVSVFNKNKLGS